MKAARFQSLVKSIIPDEAERATFLKSFRKLVVSEEFTALQSHGRPVRGFVGPFALRGRVLGDTAVNYVG